MSAEFTPANETDIRDEALAVVSDLSVMVVTNDAEFEALGAYLTRTLLPARKRITDWFAPMKAAAHAAHRAICSRETEVLAQLEVAEKSAKRLLANYAREQEEKRKEAEREAARLIAEEQARIEAERRVRAEALAAAGDVEAGVAILDAPAPLPFVPPPAVSTPKADGVAIRKQWGFRVVDADRIPRAYLIPDEKKITALVRALGPDAAEQIPGIIVEQTFSVAGRAR